MEVARFPIGGRCVIRGTFFTAPRITMALLRPHEVVKVGFCLPFAVVDVVRAHLCAPPWVPGFPGTTGLRLPGDLVNRGLKVSDLGIGILGGLPSDGPPRLNTTLMFKSKLALNMSELKSIATWQAAVRGVPRRFHPRVCRHGVHERGGGVRRGTGIGRCDPHRPGKRPGHRSRDFGVLQDFRRPHQSCGDDRGS